MNDGMLRQLGRRVAMMIGLGKITGYGDAGGIQTTVSDATGGEG